MVAKARPALPSGPWSGTRLTPLASLCLSYVFAAVSLEIIRQCVNRTWPFYVLALVRIVRSSANAIGPLTDSFLVRAARDSRRPDESYGRQRLFGSLAWGVGSLVVGALIDANGLWVVFPFTYAMIFVCLVVLGLNAVQQAAVVPKRRESGSEVALGKTRGARSPRVVLQSIRDTLLSHPQLKAFVLQVVLSGFFMTLADTVLPLQLDQEFGSSRKFNGGTTLAGILSSIPVFWWSANLLHRYGAWRMLRAAQVLLIARYAVLAMLSRNTPWLHAVLMAQQSLHGCIFSLAWSASTELVQSMATSCNITMSAQSMVSTLYFVCGQGLGNVLWMSLYDRMPTAAPCTFSVHPSRGKHIGD